MKAPGLPGPGRRDPPGPAEGFRRALRETFARAARRAGGALERTYDVGGRAVRVRFAGDALLPRLGPALAHLERPPGPAPTLTVSAWDTWSTETALPPPGWGREAYLALGEVRPAAAGGLRIAWEADAGVLSLLDLGTGAATFRIPDARRVRASDAAAPFRTIFHWWAGALGAQLAHAGAVGTPAGAALLAGRSGAGKTTTALACLRAGLGYLADDYCLLEPGPEPRVLGLYATAKLDADGLGRFPELAPAGPAGRPEGKVPVFLADRWRHRLVRAAPVRAVVLPRVSGGPGAALRPATRAESIRALAPSTMFQLPGGAREAFARAAAIAARVPAYALALGEDLSAAPALIAACLEEAGVSAAR